MPTRGRDERGRRTLSFGFLLSMVLHATLLPLLLWWALLHAPPLLVPPPLQEPEHLDIESSAVHIEHPKPQPPTATPKKPTPIQHVAQPKPAEPPRHELAVLTPAAPPQIQAHPKKPSLADQLALQEEQFAQTASRLHNENNPLSVSTSAPAPSTLHRAYMDTNGQAEQQNRYWAVLVPTKHWIDGNMSCYYTTYHTQFGNGGSEDGTIPWPVCYPKNADKMLPLDHPHELPVPYPPTGWELQGEDYITSWLRDIYDARP